ncbi:hypothetical protein GMLC_23910 [Geomonas limicola]|uniref:Dockerin domain-containing protein n=1 Tax=Geomonas limicola TaxID=2740186 RepID=A0A6V8N8A3_9BACT|nr:choice-of-anchor D domain-containing protein [Geomonas limicola]GFO68812.1 hypothetical protein GMLC_23910 [Geomonas limicola]
MKTSLTMLRRVLPALLISILPGVTALSWGATPKLAAGEGHSIILKADGTLWASGANLSGQLGDASRTPRASAVPVGSEQNWAGMAAGAEHTLAVKADGTLWSWGSNASGQLGALAPDNTPVAGQSAPLNIGGGRNWVAVAAGSASSYALKADGTLWAWGEGGLGQLGNGQTLRQNQPVQVLNPAGGRYLAVAAGADHALALMADGTLWSWGSNSFGQLGATGSDPATPRQVILTAAVSDSDWRAVAAGGNFSLALKADGTLWSWGDNAAGQLGLGSTQPQAEPVQVGTDRDWAALAAGALHVVALKRNGLCYAWGDNSSGQLGNGSLAQLNAPAPVAGIGNLVGVSAGAFHTLALGADGRNWAWGGNLDGQLGTGNQTGSLAPVPAGGAGLGWVALEPGNQFTLAGRSDGSLWSWGDNTSGQLGNGTLAAQATPAALDARHDWASHAAGFGHVVALKADGTLWSWGDNSLGQLGDGSRNPSLFPIQITNTKPTSAANDWAQVAAGDFHTLALKGDGTLWAWGDNSLGQLGDNTNTPTGKQPEQILTGNPGNFDSNWVAIAAGGGHSLGLQADGTLWAWGDNSDGQLGDPSIVGSVNFPSQIVNFNPPVDNPGFNGNWKGIAAGFAHSLALQADGTAWGWGSNFDGQLGNADGTLPNPPGQPQPVQVFNAGLAPFVALSAGDAHSVVRLADGTLWSFGRNLDGQLGIGSFDLAPVPHPAALAEATGASQWSASGIGGSHSVALKADGTLWAWGNNLAGQLGDGSDLDRNLPVPLLEGFASAPARLDLGTAFLGGAALSANLPLGNTGNGNLFVTGITLSGADAAQFAVDPGSCGSQLAFLISAKGSCQLTVSLQPGVPTGAKSALVEIATSDPVAPRRQVALSALVAQHQVTLAAGPNGSIFGPVLVNENATPSYSIVAATTFHVADVTVNGVSKGALSTLTLAPVTGDVTIGASFAIDTFAVSFTSAGNGTLSGPLNQSVPYGSASAAVTALPAPGYHFVNWTEGANVVGSNAALIVSSITAARSITANFAINSYPVSFASGGNGTLTGNVSQSVDHGASASAVSAVPAVGYHFVNWTEAGQEISASATLTLTNVTGARSVTANFAINSYPVNFSAGTNGTLIGIPNQTVDHGGAASPVSAQGVPGYHFLNWSEAGQVISTSATLTLTNVTGARSVTANFTIDTFLVSFVSGGNGSISGNASQTVALGGSTLTVTAQPALGYHFVNWTEGGSVIATTAALTLNSIAAVHNVTANFAIDTFTVTAASDAKGSISPAGVSTVNFAASLSFTFTPAAGYQVVDVLVDGVSQGAPASYTLSNVTANGHRIQVVFIPDGDLNGDGQVTIADALMALQIAVGLNQPTPAQLRHGDLAPLDASGIPAPDAQIQLADALVILKKSVGLTSGF